MQSVSKSNFFPKPIPKDLREKLALCSEYPERVLFLDIETTGLSHYYDEITIVGWSLGGQSGTFVKGQNPKSLFKAVDASVAIVTFNGIRFDQRFLKQEFPEINIPTVHIDLMYLCRRVGLTGGQKAIELELGVEFRGDLEGVDGFAAVLLWHRYLRGDLEALKLLIAYNRADIAAMGSLLDNAIDRLGYQPDLISGTIKFEEWSAPQDMADLPKNLKKASAKLVRAPTFRQLFGGLKAEKAKVVGIDLTGSEARLTGWCALNGKHAETCTISTDDEIIARTVAEKPDLISIDSPLCLPFGRNTVFDDDPARDEFGIMRQCERELKRRGVNVYPSLLPSMQKLTARGIRLAEIFRNAGLPVIESYPGAAQDIMRIPRKGAGIEWLKLGLQDFGVTGNYIDEKVTHDELDAITSALVGTFHVAGLSEGLGTKDEPPLVIPQLKKTGKIMVIGISGPIAAGKTTVAELLAKNGFAYTRFSLVIDEILKERGLELTRDNRQEAGNEINEQGRQRELAERTIDRVAGAERIVVDGLRFPEDYAFLVEKFGFDFQHVFIDAEDENRAIRFARRLNLDTKSAKDEFARALSSPVERMVPLMKDLAHMVIENNGTKAKVSNSILAMVKKLSEEN